MSGQPETITEAELADVLQRRRVAGHMAFLSEPEKVAADLFALAGKLRGGGEEVVQPGEMYEDRIGQRFYRLSSDDGWLMLPEGIRFGDDGNHPVYPLRRLVAEEAPPAPLPDPRITCAACRHTAPSMAEVAWQPDWKQWRCTDPAACHKRQQEAGMEDVL